jgi:hypothetical protein
LEFLKEKFVSHEHVITVVFACCCLHNYMRNDACHWTEEDLHISIDNIEGLENLRIGGNASLNALEVRDRFKNYFNSAAGSVEWQFNKIREGK